jgi:hypothetical protein
MRLAVCLLAALLAAAPAAAQYNVAKREPRECTRMTKQIDRYERDVKRARKTANPLWQKSMEDQIERLAVARAERCPWYPDPHAKYKQMAKWVDLAAQAAWTYLTWQY